MVEKVSHTQVVSTYVQGFDKRQWASRLGTAFMPEPRQLLTSLKYVKIVKLILEEAKHMKLVSYFMDKSPILKKFTFFLGGVKKNEESVILKKLLAMPRLSSSCEFLISKYVDT